LHLNLLLLLLLGCHLLNCLQLAVAQMIMLLLLLYYMRLLRLRLWPTLLLLVSMVLLIVPLLLPVMPLLLLLQLLLQLLHQMFVGRLSNLRHWRVPAAHHLRCAGAAAAGAPGPVRGLCAVLQVVRKLCVRLHSTAQHSQKGVDLQCR
jgi:hypothetical protein